MSATATEQTTAERVSEQSNPHPQSCSAICEIYDLYLPQVGHGDAGGDAGGVFHSASARRIIFREHEMHDAVPDGGADWDALTQRMRYVAGEYDDARTFDRLKSVLKELDDTHCIGPNRTHYLSIPPTLFEPASPK